MYVLWCVLSHILSYVVLGLIGMFHETWPHKINSELKYFFTGEIVEENECKIISVCVCMYAIYMCIYIKNIE